jgi:hypothetical protein
MKYGTCIFIALRPRPKTFHGRIQTLRLLSFGLPSNAGPSGPVSKTWVALSFLCYHSAVSLPKAESCILRIGSSCSMGFAAGRGVLLFIV